MQPFLDASERADHHRRNLLHTGAIAAALAALLMPSATLLWGWPGAVAALTLVAIVAAAGPRMPPEAVMRLYRATYVPRDTTQLSSLVDVLAFRAELPQRPALYVVPSMTLNAFAAGTRENAAIAVTEGLLRRLSLREIAGVLAHEMSHIRNGDLAVLGHADLATRLLQAAAYVALGLAVYNVLAWLTGADPLSWAAIALLYLAPTLLSLLQLQLSRAREYDADREAAALTGDAAGLASALRRVETYTGQFWEDLSLPVPARRIPQPSLLRSHPDTADRVAKLLSLDRTQDEALDIVEQPMISLVGLGPIEMRPRYRWPGLWY